MDLAFRRTRTLLAQIRSRLSDPGLVAHINSVLGRSHVILATAGASRSSRPSLNVVMEFARVVARTWVYHAIAAVVFFLGAGVAFHAVMNDPLAAYAVMPKGETRLPGTSRETLIKFLESGRDTQSGEKLAFAALLLGNNTRVGLMSMMSGIAAGVPTVFLVLYNGAILGSFTATHVRVGIHEEYWAWILPHGVPEIWAIILMSGVGFRLGAAMIAPGRISRKRALLEAGHDGMVVAVGCAVLLLAAACIESHIRQSYLSANFRHMISLGGFLLLSLYFAAGAWMERKEARLARMGLVMGADGQIRTLSQDP
jgi:uncharacterized membrane protein SpoIIM required for sporulation